MSKKLYPGQQPSGWVRPDGSKPKVVPKPLIFLGGGIWASIVLAAILLNGRDAKQVPQVQTAPAVTAGKSAQPMVAASDPPFLHELPLTKSDATRLPKPTVLSESAMEVKRLWGELQAFRYDPKFHVLGFDPPWKYAEWAGEVRTLNARAGQAIFKEISIHPQELLDVAEEYRRSRGMETERSRRGEDKLAGALSPAARGKGEGRLPRDTQGCADFDMWARSARALDVGDMDESNTLLEQAGCVSVAGGTVVSAPTRRRSFDWVNSPKPAVSILVSVNGRELWIAENEVEF